MNPPPGGRAAEQNRTGRAASLLPSPGKSVLEGATGRMLVTALPYGWLVLFFLIPFIIVLKISFAEMVSAIPPYTPLAELVDDTFLQIRLNLANYLYLLEDGLYISAYLSSIRIAAIATFFCLVVGYPMAYAIARAPSTIRNSLLLLVMLPFWTSFLIRVYAWIGILKDEGLLNNFLMAMGLIETPLSILHTDWAVYIGLVYSYLPFMVLPLYATLEKMDLSLLEAAADLGCRPLKAFALVTFPLSIPGLVAGSMLVFIPAVGEFVIPDLLGGPDTLMIGKVLWTDFFTNRDWPMASAVAVAMLVVLVVPIMVFQRYQAKAEEGR
jgi:putrescine transport system permease protein